MKDFPTKRHGLMCLFILLCSLSSAYAQTPVSGVVTSATDNMPLPGVTVVLKNSSRGVATDFDGNYEISVSGDNAVLVFSYMGYISQEIPVNGRKTIDVSLKEDISKLDEVVVVGYGTQKKATMTGAVSTVSSETIQNRPATGMTTALQGTVPGLSITRSTGQPGEEGLSMEIRGVSSANGATPPLVIIDGVTSRPEALQGLNPSDVESVSVLKDGAAAAIYGARAAGGVILITTRTGTKGKAVFEYTGQLTAQWALNVPDRLSLLEEAEYSNLARANAGIGPEYSDFDLENIRNNIPYVVDPENPNKYIMYNQRHISEDVLRKVYFMHNHNFSARGGSEKIRYNFSLGYQDQDGIFKIGPDQYTRWNARINVSADLTKHLNLDSRIYYTDEYKKRSSSTINGYGLFQQVYQARTRFPIFTPEGKLFGGAGSSGNNTYALLKEGGYVHDNFGGLNSVFTLTAKDFVKGLEFRTIYGREDQRRDLDTFRRTVELWDRADTPVYLLNNPNFYEVNRRNIVTQNFQFLVDYDLTLAEKHNFHVLAGYQWEDFTRKTVVASASNMFTNDLPSLNFADQENLNNSESVGEFANQSLLGRFNYTYDDKYLLEFTLRSDESSRLAPGQRVKWFTSASGGWNMHRESWFSDNISFISQLKPRFSWGQLGGANSEDIIGNYSYLPILSVSNNLVLGQDKGRNTYVSQGSIPSSSLAWETIETFNYGIDFGFFGNKLSGSFDFYEKFNKNMLVRIPRPATLGVTPPMVNTGELKSWGWELNLNYRNRIGENFKYNVGLNLSDNQNKLINYGGVSVVSDGNNTRIEGMPLRTLWGYETVPGYIETDQQLAAAPFYHNNTGIGDIEYVDLDGDGRITPGDGNLQNPGDLRMMGTTDPRYLFGVTLGGNWKNIDFNFFFQGVGKRNIIPSIYVRQPLQASWIQPRKYHMDYYTPDNPDAAFPRPFLAGGHNFVASDRWILNAAYVRLKNMQIGYSLPESVLEKIGFSRFRIYCSAEDILTFTNLGPFKGVIDPEQRDLSNSDYPLSGKLALGINLAF